MSIAAASSLETIISEDEPHRGHAGFVSYSKYMPRPNNEPRPRLTVNQAVLIIN